MTREIVIEGHVHGCTQQTKKEWNISTKNVEKSMTLMITWNFISEMKWAPFKSFFETRMALLQS